jgi:AcrR family transcriptional regulator
MKEKRRLSREDRRAGLVGAARARIAASGLANLRARDVTADTGSALGGLYNAFADLDDLVLHANAETLRELRVKAEEGLAAATGPRGALKALAAAYLAFARENRALWSALFDHRMADGRELPDWYAAEQTALIRLICGPLARLEPDLDDAALLTRARTLFGAIHGIVSISTEGRFIGVADVDLDGELGRFVDIIVSGTERGGQAGA